MVAFKGNQAEHFLGAMSFAKSINRTLVIPPFRTYKNVPYKEWFKPEKLNAFHRSIPADDFMQQIAPKYWPLNERRGFCYGSTECQMQFGNPANQFWKELGVDEFTNNINFLIDFNEPSQWLKIFPAGEFPVIALRGAPASFPVKARDRDNQRYMVWSDDIIKQVNEFLTETFGNFNSQFIELLEKSLYFHNFLDNEKFIGIHLRNGIDWENACGYIDKENDMANFMASPQCLENSDVKLNKNLCFPSTEIILNDLENIIVNELKGKVRNIYVATDKMPMIKEIKSRFSGIIDKVVHYDPWLPVLDLAILARSEYFIGNCVSSFTAFVKRERDVNKKESAFWAI